jgi:mannonate dehydratase
MNRRDFLGRMTAGAALAALVLGEERSVALGAAPPAVPPQDDRGESGLRITRVRAILTAPERIRLVVVKVETSDPGLWGVGCATFTQRPRTVVTAVDEYLHPFLLGKHPDHIEDIWQASFQSSYWRNGPVLMNALSGVDMALWDIKGKRAGMPVYQLLGGKCRVAAPVYGHAGGSSGPEAVESARRFLDRGYRYIRVQVGVPGQSAYGSRGGRDDARRGDGQFAGNIFEPTPYQLAVPRVFEHVRKELGDEIELLHDIHERLHPIQAMQLTKDLERFRLFFVEDPFAPEDIGYFRHLRQQCATPIAMGELFNNPNEWVGLVSERLIDFIRCHLSQIGGISMGRKIAALCEFFRVRTAWHGPGDASPVGHAANLHLDLSAWNFGIQEAHDFNDTAREVFPGTPEIRDGMLHAGDRPGLGVDIDEAAAARHPIRDDPPFDLQWGRLRGQDGTIRRP